MVFLPKTSKAFGRPPKDDVIVNLPKLNPGDVWKLRFGAGAMLSRDRVMRIISIDEMSKTLKASEVPFSKLEVEIDLRTVTFIEKIPQE